MKSVPESSGNNVRFFNCHDIVLIESTLLILHVFQNSLSPTIIITTTKVLRAGLVIGNAQISILSRKTQVLPVLAASKLPYLLRIFATVMIKINTTIVVTFIILTMMMQAGEKVTLGISILLSLVVFLLLVSKILVIIMIRMMMVMMMIMMMMGMVIIMMVMLIMMLAASHLPRAASDSQVSTLHLHHEHSQV